jgi:hypothetical protein
MSNKEYSINGNSKDGGLVAKLNGKVPNGIVLEFYSTEESDPGSPMSIPQMSRTQHITISEENLGKLMSAVEWYKQEKMTALEESKKELEKL